MVAPDRYERHEEERRAGGAAEDHGEERVQQVERVEHEVHTEHPLNVRPFPRSSTANVNVAQRPDVAPPAAATGPDYAVLAVGKTNQILWFICGVLELLLALRAILRLVAANPAAPFVAFIYAITQPLVAPFLGMLPNLADPNVRTGAVLEVPTLVAMLIYFLIFLLLTMLLRLLVSRPRAA